MTGGLRKAAFFILLLGVAYAGHRYMIKPANLHLLEQRRRLQTKLAKLDKFEKATAAAAGLAEQLDQLKDAIEYFESKLPSESEIANVLEQVTIIAQKQALEPKTIRTLKKKPLPVTMATVINPKAEDSGYVEQPLKMELVGDFTSFYSFLLELEKLPRIMKIRQLELRKQPKSEGQISADFIVSIFFEDKTG